jgi:hypothetical protein
MKRALQGFALRLAPVVAATVLTAGPALAEIRWCPIDRAYYDTETGLIVDRPSYSAPSRPSYRAPRGVVGRPYNRPTCRRTRTSYGYHITCN